MVAVCPATEPARLLASSPAIGHACSLTRSRVEAADGTAELCPRCVASLECFVLPVTQEHSIQASSSAQVLAAAFYVRHFTTTLEPALCARKEEADNESLSTSERIMNESLPMRSINPSFETDSVRSSSASSTPIPTTFPDGFRSDVTANKALQRTAPGCHGSCYSRSGVSPSLHLFRSSGALSASHLRSYRASPPRSLSLESLGVSSRHLWMNDFPSPRSKQFLATTNTP